MNKYSFYRKRLWAVVVCFLALTACSGTADSQKPSASQNQLPPQETAAASEPDVSESAVLEPDSSEPVVLEEEGQKAKEEGAGITGQDAFKPAGPEPNAAEPEIVDTDWSSYFQGLKGGAVIYDPSSRQYRIYNKELAQTRRSPCSTFKIISSLIALEHGIILPDSSVRTWSGERFWNEKWNQDMDFSWAFRESCVWYFREVINEIGQERMKEELERLEYGNKDISDWQGQKNTSNKNPALTGFWIESSLLISPKEQTEVLERIFGADSVYSKEIQDELKQVMAVQGQDNPTIYGKTGMGKAHGVVVDAWFAGFAETEKGNLYFCVYLGENKEGNVSSTAAKEIAVEILRQTVQ